MAWADGVLVTADSCSMLSEAVSLGIPVFVARFEHAKGKMSKFLAALATLAKLPHAREHVNAPEGQSNILVAAPGLGVAARPGREDAAARARP